MRFRLRPSWRRRNASRAMSRAPAYRSAAPVAIGTAACNSLGHIAGRTGSATSTVTSVLNFIQNQRAEFATTAGVGLGADGPAVRGALAR
jgi:hypothetical protein